MGKYIVTTGQNIFDVALHIYGAIEGVLDLMINNPDLSYCSIISAGKELIYSDDYVVEPSIVAYNQLNTVVPANGERNVYFKAPPNIKEWICVLMVPPETNSFCFSIKALDEAYIDWGDNSPIEVVIPDPILRSISHYFDNKQRATRRIKIWTKGSISQLYLEELPLESVLFFRDAGMEELRISKYTGSFDFLSVLSELNTLSISGTRVKSLLPLIHNLKMARLDLSGIEIQQSDLDIFLMSLVENYSHRRNCSVKLPKPPSGRYEEPERDQNGNYLLKWGMEAVWLLTNEPSWNEGGFWSFQIGDQLYTSTP